MDGSNSRSPSRKTATRLLTLVVVNALGAVGCGAPAAGPRDDGGSDGAAPIDAAQVPVSGPSLLSQTGLYADFAARTLSSGIVPYTPRYPLWSDGAEKQRYLSLPPGATIDTSAMDDWVFPVGTRAWKEFTAEGKVVETRLLEKKAEGWWKVAYLWRSDGSDADAVADGALDVLGTTHDVPSQDDCQKCHGNVRDVLIGVSAIQLSAADGQGTLSRLAATGRLSSPPSHEFEVPGSGVVKDALGYLHGNCGHCHNDGSFFSHKSVLRLRLRVTDSVVEATPTYTTSINVRMFHHMPPDIDLGVVPGLPDKSQLFVRMSSRDEWAMPPVCTKAVDPVGEQTLRSWITSLPH